MVADAALRGAADDGVLHAVAGEDAEAPVVHLDRELHDRRAAIFLDDLHEAGIELQALRGFIELQPGVLEGVQLFLELGTHVHTGRAGDGAHRRGPCLDGAK